VLCGGLGSRLGALTAATPKVLLPVGDRPFLDHLLQEAGRFGFEEIVLLAGSMAGQLVERYHRKRCGTAVLRVETEPAPAGTAGALRHAIDILDPVFLLANGDSWVDMDLTLFQHGWDLARAALSPAPSMHVLLAHAADRGRYGTVELAGGRITGFREKARETSPCRGLINAGVYVVDRQVLATLPPGQPVSLEAGLLPALVREGRVTGQAAPASAYFIDIGVPEDYRRAQAELPARRLRGAVIFDRDGTLNEDVGYTHRVEDLRWVEGAVDAVRAVNASGRWALIATNQSGLARGLYEEKDLLAFHREMQRRLYAHGAHIDGLLWCPHHPEGRLARLACRCDCRKPAPGLLERFLHEWPISPAATIVIGDQASDMQAAHAAGLRGVLYRGGRLDAYVTAE
jgi:D-glycero-D-manno-heptose 1,7-bisphosphate phosphatase